MNPKIKKLLIRLIPIIGPFLLSISLFVLVIILIIAPVQAAKESTTNFANGVGDFFERFGGLFTGRGWNTAEEAYYKLIDKVGCEKAKIVTSTLMYYYQVSPHDEIDIQENNDTEEVEVDPEELPYGELLSDAKKLVKWINDEDPDKYEENVKNKLLNEKPYKKMLEGVQDVEAEKDRIYNDMISIASSVECPYESTVAAVGTNCSYNVEGEEISNLKVQLLNCKSLEPINEEPIDFEKYILGVVYQEVGESFPDETVKAKAIAARNYALTRGQVMEDPIGTIEDNGDSSVLYLRSCTTDQVYCNPDEGCWSDANGGEMNNAPDATVYSGSNASAKWSKGALSNESRLRTLVASTVGMVVVDQNDDIIVASYTSNDQNTWKSYANSGMDYYQILLKHYSSIGATDIKSFCTAGFGNLEIAGFSSTGNGSVCSKIVATSSEPDPSSAINYWDNKGYINSDDYIYPKDSATGLPLGAWPKDYASIPSNISYSKIYNNTFIFPLTPSGGKYNFVYEHNGIDIMSSIGTPIYSPVDGTLVYSEWGHTVNKGCDETAYSVTVRLDAPMNIYGVNVENIYLTHMSGIRYRCSRGNCNRRISKGELVGFVGNGAGTATSAGYAPHLHMTLYNSSYSAGITTSNIEALYKLGKSVSITAGG